MAILSYSSSGP